MRVVFSTILALVMSLVACSSEATKPFTVVIPRDSLELPAGRDQTLADVYGTLIISVDNVSCGKVDLADRSKRNADGSLAVVVGGKDQQRVCRRDGAKIVFVRPIPGLEQCMELFEELRVEAGATATMRNLVPKPPGTPCRWPH